jgi:RNA polymerase sigma-70 factor (ECF subfamily)
MALSFRTSQLLGLLDRMRAAERLRAAAATPSEEAAADKVLRAAADELFRRVGDRLERLARKMVRGFPAVRRREGTGDVLQNASLRLLRALEQVRPDCTRKFFALASLQIRRELLDLTRHYRVENARHHSDGVAASAGPPAHEPADPAPGPDELEAWCEVHRQIDGLPEEEREVADLCFYQGLTKAEAAELLGVDVRTIQRRWNAALSSLHPAPQAGPPGRGA